ncbi:MAG: cytidylate kinase [Thermoprotei archaeon]|nr:MAG: cytidylate kinase [Thermoprotei archaeon]
MSKKKLTVAISGQPASGKTTYAKFIAHKYNLRYVSSGQLFREYAREKGLSLLELHKLAEKDPSIDREIDRRALEEAKKGGVVIEGHLAAWIVKDFADVRIFFKAPLQVRSRRLAERDRKTLEEAAREILFRERSNKERAKKYYSIDLDDWSIFDLIIDTSFLNIEDIKTVLIVFMERFIRRKISRG